MPDRSDPASLSYLERLLRLAVAERGSPPEPFAGRAVAALLAMATAEGGGRLVSEYLVPEPGQEATYEVRGNDPGDREQAVLSADLSAVAAFRAAVRFNREGIGGIKVYGRTAAGVERCALNRTTDGGLEYLFPVLHLYTGPDAAVQRAIAGWSEALRSTWSEALGATEDDPWASSALDLGWRGQTAGAGTAPSPGRERMPSAAEIADAVHSAMKQMTVDIDLTEMESVIRRTVDAALGEWVPGPVAGGSTNAAARQRPALVPPPSGQTARQEGALDQIRPLLSEISVTERQLLSGFSSQSGILSIIAGTVEHMELQVRELREQIRTSSSAIRPLTEQIAVLVRRSDAAANALTAAVGEQLDRFGDRLEETLSTDDPRPAD